MEMQLMNESIQLEQPLGTCRSQAVVEGDVTLPGGLREETRVMSADALAVVENAEAMQDRVNVGGRVVFHVLYTQGDPEKVNCIEAAADFTHLCELAGSQPRAAVLAQAQVEHVEASVLNGRMSMRAVLRIVVRVLSQSPVALLTGVTGLTGVQTKTRQLSIRRTVASGSSDVLLREELALPDDSDIRETLYATAIPVVNDVTGGLGRIGLTGQVLLEVIHASNTPGKPVLITRHSIPLEQTVEIAGENGDLLDARVQVKDVAVASQDMGDGERMLRVEVLLGLQGWADRQENITVLSDAYTTSDDDLHLTTRSLRCRTGEHRQQCAESGKAMLLLPEGAAPIRNVLAAFITPVVTGREQVGGRLTVEGVLEATLLYMTEDGAAPVTVFQEEPFRMSFAAQADAQDFVTLTAGEVDALPITSDRVELRYIMRMNVEGVDAEDVRIVTDAQPVAAAQPTEDIVLYFTQPGETLWDIARRYRVSTDSVRELNPELTGEPRSGQGVVVWRRCRESQCG